MMLVPLGDSALLIVLGELIDEAMAARVRALATEFERHPPAGVVDVVPAFASVAVFYDVTRIGGLDRLQAEVEALVTRAEASVVSVEGRRMEIPVSYGGAYGPDLDAVAAHAGLRPAEVIALHSSPEYLVHAIGFAPGFPYLGGMPGKLVMPRRATPRARVAGGSVGIGGAQTGVYPIATPGGWNIIGRTPMRLFDPRRDPPALLKPGDRVKFRPMFEGEFAAVEEAAAASPPGAAPAANAPVESAPGIRVVRGGMFTTVQDLGRTGYRASGVVQGGASDSYALRVANLLVGNPETEAALEFTLVGPELTFLHDSVVALGGAEFEGLPRWQPVRIAAGTQLRLGKARTGYRGYLAVAGGIAVPTVLGSRGTHVRAAFGGHEGRPLRDGDVLPVPHAVPRVLGRWHIDERILPAYSHSPVIRVVPGAERGQFGDDLFTAEFKVSAQSDRMGLRLAGPELARKGGRDILSSAVAPGTMQVPPDGRPIALLSDAQTIGGYPRIAHAITVDLPLLAQLRPGDTVRFREVPLAEAHELALAREHALAMLREGLAQKLA